MYNTINNLREEAVLQKRMGEFQQSLNLYIKSLQLDATSFDALNTYYALGKLAYLMKNPRLALSSYLAAIHLELSRVENDILNNTLPEHVQIALKPPIGVMDKLPAKSAAIIYHDPHKPRHVAHALVDFEDDFLKENKINPKLAYIYRSSILGDDSYDKVVELSGLTHEFIVNKDEYFYHNMGIKYIINNGINWSWILSPNVYSIYSIEENL